MTGLGVTNNAGVAASNEATKPWDVAPSLLELITNVSAVRRAEVRSLLGFQVASGAELLSGASKIADKFDEFGVGAGSCVAVAAPTSLELVQTLLATWLLGATCLVLPSGESALWPRRIRCAGSQLLVVHESLEQYSDAVHDIDVRMTLRRSGQVDAVGRCSPGHLNAASRVVQFSSGTTGESQALLLSEGGLAANLAALAKRMELTASDTVVSWLPLYHDMGLIGSLLLPIVHGANVRLSDTDAYRRDPRTWLSDLDGVPHCVTIAPHRAFAIATRILQRSRSRDLSGLRLVINGAESINAAEYRAFLAAASAYGLDPRVAASGYGLAQCTLGVTLTSCGSGFQSDSVVDDGPELAYCGRPLDGVEVRVDRRNAHAGLPDAVGEILVRSPSNALGYLTQVDDRVTIVPGDEWVRTGDLGSVDERGLRIAGRSKHVIASGGRQVCAEDIEAIVALELGLPVSRVAAFTDSEDPARGRPVVAIEANRPNAANLVAVQKLVYRTLGISLRSVLVVPTGRLPRTTSGKLQRSECRQLLGVD